MSAIKAAVPCMAHATLTNHGVAFPLPSGTLLYSAIPVLYMAKKR